MALARLHRKVEDTVGKGDCAFNAFTLGLCQSDVLHQITSNLKKQANNLNKKPKEYIDKHLAWFIEPAAVALGVDASWNDVKTELIHLREHDKGKLQYKIAPVMRQLAYKIGVDAPNWAYYVDMTCKPLLGAFNDYRRKQRSERVTGQDDIFSRHSFIQAKFKKVYAMKGKTDFEQDKLMQNWWWRKGYSLFQQRMAQKGVWAGDLELARLAKFFNVVLDVVPREGYVYNICGNYGRFPFLTDDVEEDIPYNDRGEVIQNLFEREVLEREGVHEDGIDFIVPNFSDIHKRIGQIPFHGVVADYLLKNGQVKGRQVPDWRPEIIEALIQRNVVGRAPSGKGYRFSVDVNQAFLRIQEIPYYKEILKICRNHYKVLPTIVLYKTPDHWENTIRYLTPGEKEKKQRSEKISAALRENNLFTIASLPFKLTKPFDLNNSDDHPLRRLQ